MARLVISSALSQKTIHSARLTGSKSARAAHTRAIVLFICAVRFLSSYRINVITRFRRLARGSLKRM